MLATTDIDRTLPRYCDVSQTSQVCGVPEKRVRDWQRAGLLPVALKTGRLQYRVADVVRCFLYVQLQLVLGQDSGVATRAALAFDDDQLMSILRGRNEITTSGHSGVITLRVDEELREVLLERLGAVPR
jgi:hypothetical protein